MWHRGPKPVVCRFLLFLLNHNLHCICFKVLFTVSKYLVSNWSYTRLIGTMKKVKKLNKKFQIFRVNIIVRNHYILNLKIVRVIKSLILYQTKQTALKSVNNVRSYDKFTDTSWIEELQTRKHVSLLFVPLAQYLGSDKRFWALRHILSTQHMIDDWMKSWFAHSFRIFL